MQAITHTTRLLSKASQSINEQKTKNKQTNKHKEKKGGEGKNKRGVCIHVHKKKKKGVTKFFGNENGALSRFDSDRMVGIVNGAHQASELQKDLKKYINEFILCPQCKLPELQTKVDANKSLLVQKCMSCNWKGKNISPNKTKTYMINNPPDKKKAPGGGEATKEKKKHTTEDKPSTKKLVSSAAAKDDENDPSWQTDQQDKEIAKRTQEQLELLAKSKRARLTKVKGKSTEKEKEKEDEDESPAGEEATAQTEAASGPAANVTSDTSMDATLGGPVDVLRAFFTECHHSLDEQLDELYRLQLAYGLDDEQKYKVLLDAALNCNDEQTLMESLKEHKFLLQQLTLEPADAEQFFRTFEVILARRNQGRLQEFVNEILLCLFDEEIIDEESILNWYEKESERSLIEISESKLIKNAGKMFIEWLKYDYLYTYTHKIERNE
ncbi:eukaryotic translation initiation factor 5 [Reticulomyxa filosa]|uniref:Eukaryotic translation initiation factor 5 n=1 Tax=Reticulomyxa filosa TaxID=46433 RepID=X6MLX0_RETFI|nr:eukaryotic translation initiation factor 5 [Reticulomyxa filosa]|eukprot:ETO14844.1 eukaryotic translation initiation factor 5 [Reticulomyxa filosa]